MNNLNYIIGRWPHQSIADTLILSYKKKDSL
jgi:hypothetical protein